MMFEIRLYPSAIEIKTTLNLHFPIKENPLFRENIKSNIWRFIKLFIILGELILHFETFISKYCTEAHGRNTYN